MVTCTVCHPTPIHPSAPDIPHTTQGYPPCYVCHKMGINGAPRLRHPVPPDIADNEDKCKICHK
jgi:hypothetical protein